MPVSRRPTVRAWSDPDDAPDLSGPEWRAKMDAAPVVRPRGRPPKPDRKIEIKLRVDPKVLDAFKAGGPGWQTRMHDALRRAAEVD